MLLCLDPTTAQQQQKQRIYAVVAKPSSLNNANNVIARVKRSENVVGLVAAGICNSNNARRGPRALTAARARESKSRSRAKRGDRQTEIVLTNDVTRSASQHKAVSNRNYKHNPKSRKKKPEYRIYQFYSISKLFLPSTPVIRGGLVSGLVLLPTRSCRIVDKISNG